MKRKESKIMFHYLCSLLIASLCWQYVTSRHIAQHAFYPPYSGYNYGYAGLGPYHQPYHPPFFTPPGTYFDQRQGILRPFPGGGVPVSMEYHKRCPNNFVGLRAHPKQQQYYYVCKADSIIFGKCQNLQIFNATSGQCVQHPPPEYQPACPGLGRFPLFSDCHLYFKCEADLKPKIYSCPTSMIFSPASQKCINGSKCTPTQISPHGSYIPEMCAGKFPPCFENGIFRSPSDCSLYYKCELQKNGVFMQTRLKCPHGHFYDLQHKDCLPAKEVPCDCIQVAELVYPKTHTLPFQPTVYPAQFELDSMVDGHYPVEQGNDSIIEINNDCNRKTNEFETESQAAEATTINPLDLASVQLTTSSGLKMLADDFVAKEQDDDDDDGTTQRIEDEEVITTALPEEFLGSSALTTSEQESSTEPETNKDNITDVTEATTEEVTQLDTTTASSNESPAIIEEQAVLSQSLDITETTTITSETEKENEIPASKSTSSPGSLEPKVCEKLIKNERTGDADTQTKDPSQTQTKNCLTRHKPLKTAHKSEIKEKKRNLISHKTIKSTTPPTTPTAKLAKAIISERNNLIEKAMPTQAFEKTSAGIKRATKPLIADIKTLQTEIPMTTLLQGNVQQTVPTHSISTNSIEEDISYEDILESEITKKTKAEFSEHKLNAKLDLNSELEQQAGQASKEIDLQNLDNQLATSKPASETLESPDLQATTVTPPQATTTIQTNPTATNKKLLFGERSEDSTDVPFMEEDNGSTELDSKIKINNFETATESLENLDENLLLSEELLPLAKHPADHLKNKSHQKNISKDQKSVNLEQVELSDENFIPVHSKDLKLNDIKQQDSSLLETGFDDDDTTISAGQEVTTTSAATTISNEKVEPIRDVNNEIKLFNKITTINRRQTVLVDDVIPTTTTTTTQTTLVGETLTNITTEQAKSTKTEEKHSLDDEESDESDILDSEIVIPSQDSNKNTDNDGDDDEEVSNNEITSAEKTQTTTTNSNHQNLLPTHTPSTTPLTATTQITRTAKRTANITTTTTYKPSEKQTNNLVLHIRKQDPEQQSTLDLSPSRKSLYYILKTKPVINNNSNSTNETKTINELVTATQDTETGSGEVPRLEIIAERPIDIHFSICRSTCDKDHSKSIAGKRAVLLKWFARKSKQTIGFETAN